MSGPIINTTEKRFAVIVGINYIGTENELQGCINDASHLKDFLINKAGYSSENIMMLLDNGTVTRPTKQNIIKGFNTLVEKANDGFTELWFSYSGHGTSVKDKNGDEADGFDEAICPVDFNESGFIIDDFIYDNLVVKLPETATLFTLFDSCHSGTILDLPYIYNTSFAKNNSNKQHVATVFSISGCRDNQTSADAFIDNTHEGAMTWSFLTSLSQNSYDIKLVDLVKNMRTLLKENSYTQYPLLAVSSETQYDRLLINLQSSPIADHASISRSIKFSIRTDFWYSETSWNVWSEETKSFLFPSDKKFTNRYQLTELTLNLSMGDYKLVIKDKHGDGGMRSKVTNGSVSLVSAKMAKGSSAEYGFKVI